MSGTMKTRWRRGLCGLLLSTMAATMLNAGPVFAAAGDPTFTVSGVNNPCGLAVDPGGNFYVSSYYDHAISVFGSNKQSITKISNVDPTGGPCGLAIDNENSVFVNGFHNNVLKLDLEGSEVDGSANFVFSGVFDSDEPTGVAVNPGLEKVYVNSRTHVSVYNPTGAPEGTLGAGIIEDGYGIAVSQFSGTAGLIYLPDAASDTVKVINSSGVLQSSFGASVGLFPGFKSLRDSTVAVSRDTGDIYVADHLGPGFSERPESVSYVFDSTNGYKGRLKFNVIDPRPVGLAIDNSAGPNLGRVYVGTGASGGAVYAYPPGSAVLNGSPAEVTLSVSSVGSGRGSILSDDGGIDCAASCSSRLAGGEETVLRVQPAPGSTFVGWTGGGCSGTDACAVTMTEEQSVSAKFAALPPVTGDDGPSTAATSQRPDAGRGNRHRHKHSHRAKFRRGSQLRLGGHRRG